MTPGPDEGGQAWTGPWAHDAQRLFQWLADTAGEHTGPQEPAHGDAASSASAVSSPGCGPECRYCPFCQGMAWLRRSGPDALEKVAELAAGLAATLRAQADQSAGYAPGQAPAHQPGQSADRQERQPADERPGADAGASPAAPRSPDVVVPGFTRIDITD